MPCPAPEEDADDGQHDKGHQQEDKEEQHALLGVGLEDAVDELVQQQQAEQDQRQRDDAVGDEGGPGGEPFGPVEHKFVQHDPDRRGQQRQPGRQQAQRPAAQRAEVDAHALG